MSATDELRRLLDERGVEWRYKDERTTYWYGTFSGMEWCEWTAIDYNGYLRITCADCGELLTPAQVIAATLGDVPRLPYFWTADGTLHIELPRLPESISVRLPDQRDREVGSARTWQYTLGVVDTEACQADTDGLDCGHVRNSSAKLEAENAKLIVKLNAEHIVRQNAEAENAKLRELAKEACELARIFYDCGGTFNDLDDLLCEASELGIEVDS